ncbi:MULTISPECIES: RidA family protein [unclassified Schaalia]|uniref:RidA family protein n=1 Tax=unclassified Schaalia TaxID=2691889 RepID=UPI001E4D1835|nr:MULTISPECIES: RidA family protein [unclassified Schaalia]MCD4550053.1 RidA family protein [Schaalia sp. lx-260]MCD4557880.1 RidA family protein [Schaalia sp. lx-100]
MTTLSQRLQERGIELPEVPTPVAAYVPAVIDRGVVRTSGQLPMENGELACIGAVGADGADFEDARDAARVCALNALAAAAAEAGGVDRLERVIKVTAFVASLPDFYNQAQVVNGASEFYADLFGSLHARSAVGVASLPLNASVEIEVEFALADSHNIE